MQITTRSVEETRKVGARVAAVVATGQTFGLVGDLGCGKTEFVRGFADALDHAVVVRSPSFTLVNCYETPAFPVYHFDFYRLKKSSELVEIGFREYVGGNGVCIIEWADMFAEEMPDDTIFIRFSDLGDGKRLIELPEII